jgi:hypothetical protein
MERSTSDLNSVRTRSTSSVLASTVGEMAAVRSACARSRWKHLHDVIEPIEHELRCNFKRIADRRESVTAARNDASNVGSVDASSSLSATARDYPPVR